MWCEMPVKIIHDTRTLWVLNVLYRFLFFLVCVRDISHAPDIELIRQSHLAYFNSFIIISHFKPFFFFFLFFLYCYFTFMYFHCLWSAIIWNTKWIIRAVKNSVLWNAAQTESQLTFPLVCTASQSRLKLKE